jgi:hypothetical protein
MVVSSLQTVVKIRDDAWNSVWCRVSTAAYFMLHLLGRELMKYFPVQFLLLIIQVLSSVDTLELPLRLGHRLG